MLFSQTSNIIFTVDSDCLKHLETKLADKDIPQQSALPTASLHTAASLKMSCAHQVNVSEVADHLKQLKTERHTTDITPQAAMAISSPKTYIKDTTQQGTGRNHGDEVSKESVVRSKVKGNTRDMKDTLMALDLFSREVVVLKKSKWKKLCVLPQKRPLNACICIVANELVIVGEDVTLSFSLSTKQWKRLKQIPTPRPNSSAAVMDERLIVMGGIADGEASSVCEIFHVRHNEWSSAASLPVPLWKPLVAVLLGNIYILKRVYQLESTPKQDRTKMLVFEPSSNTYTHRVRLPSNIASTEGACLVGVTDMLYLLGGEDRLAWQYNPHTDQWIQLVTPIAGYYTSIGGCAVERDNNILLCGGRTKGMRERNMIEEYSKVTQQWKVLDIRLPFEYDQYSSSVLNVSV